MKTLTSMFLVLVLSVGVFAKPCLHDYRHIASVANDLGFLVTSTTGGRHNTGSKHYVGKAIDVRVYGHSNVTIDLFIQLMTDMGYVVLDERVRPRGQRIWGGPHIHIHAPFCEDESLEQGS